jgi:hypothetical protein
MSDEITNEFQARMKSVAMEFLGSRKASGDITTTMMFALLSILKSKNKITEKDIDIIFEVEKESIAAMFQEYFDHTNGDRNAKMQNEEELLIARGYAFKEIDNYKKQVLEASQNLKPERKQGKSNGSGEKVDSRTTSKTKKTTSKISKRKRPSNKQPKSNSS